MRLGVVEVGRSNQTAGVRVKVHPGLCQGWGNCHRFASAVYSLDAEGYVDFHVLEVPAELVDAAKLGAEICPAQAITIIALSSAENSQPSTAKTAEHGGLT
ncbi:MAG: ferredoxin [Acidimicrobiia bacterium]|jgi:ferredoxin|nr:ferredoxin [Acidimicrobiia bacterium]MBP8180155.1 ferredoxin [Acidimicrobiia bacterium]